MPFVSKAQRRYFHWARGQGIIPESTVEHWEEVTPENADLPERIHPKKKKKRKAMPKQASLSAGLFKVAVELYREALITDTAPMQTAVPASDLRNNATTAQARGRATRSGNILNEDRQFAGKYYHNWRNSRVP